MDKNEYFLLYIMAWVAELISAYDAYDADVSGQSDEEMPDVSSLQIDVHQPCRVEIVIHNEPEYIKIESKYCTIGCRGFIRTRGILCDCGRSRMFRGVAYESRYSVCGQYCAHGPQHLIVECDNCKHIDCQCCIRLDTSGSMYELCPKCRDLFERGIVKP